MTIPPFRRILVVPLRYIGDTVLTVPLTRNLRMAYPETRLDMLVSRTTEPLMAVCPYVDDVLIEPKGLAATGRMIQAGNYDAVFILRKSVTMAALCRLAGIPNRIGYDKQRFPFGYKRWGWFLTHQAIYPSLRTTVPQPVSHLGLLTAAGIPVCDDHLELWTTPEDEARITTLLGEASAPLAVVHASSASHGKHIDPKKFALSLQQLHQAGYRLAATGTAADAALYEQLAARYELPILNLAGVTTLRETVALYRRTHILLSVDSSPLHLAAAAGVPRIVGVFGPTNERQWGPHNPQARFAPVFMDLPCRPCYAKVCSHNNCRVQLTEAHIAQGLARVLDPS